MNAERENYYLSRGWSPAGVREPEGDGESVIPPRTAGKKAWVAYAESAGGIDDPSSLTKDKIVAHYLGEGDSDGSDPDGDGAVPSTTDA